MQRARRLASVAVLVAVAVTGLSACRSQPDVAAYLSAGNITVARVQQIYDDARAKHDRDLTKQAAAAPSPAPTDPAAAGPERLSLTGSAVLTTLVSHEVLTRVAQKHNAKLPSSLPLADYATLLKLPADSEYVRLYVEVEGLQFVLNQAVQGGTLTDADIRDIYDRVKTQNALPAGDTADQFAASLSADGKKALGNAVAIRNEVRADLNQQRVRLNPRYQPFDVPVLTQRGQDGSAVVLVATPVGDRKAAVPVTDVA